MHQYMYIVHLSGTKCCRTECKEGKRRANAWHRAQIVSHKNKVVYLTAFSNTKPHFIFRAYCGLNSRSYIRHVSAEFQILFKSTKVILISIIDFHVLVIKSSIIPRVFNDHIPEGRRLRLNDYQFKIVEV